MLVAHQGQEDTVGENFHAASGVSFVYSQICDMYYVPLHLRFHVSEFCGTCHKWNRVLQDPQGCSAAPLVRSGPKESAKESIKLLDRTRIIDMRHQGIGYDTVGQRCRRTRGSIE